MIGSMTDRGVPIVDGAPACPFVAFEDDRDERANSPDHRHRCYAEPNPAPRALAHQEAYCLSSAFPVCPTFQDWARREAARSRTAGSRPTESDAAAIAAAGHAQRNPPRNWSAPPPWSSRGSRAAEAASGGLWDEKGQQGDDADERAGPGPTDTGDAVPHRARGLSGSYADRVAADAAPPMPGGHDPGEDRGPRPPEEPPAPFRTEPSAPRAPAAPAAPAAGPAPGPARRAEPTPAFPSVHDRSGEGWHGPEGSDDEDVREATSRPTPQRSRERDPSRVPAFLGHDEPRATAPERRPERRRDPAAPEWERARPMEAYPALRARRLPELSVPPLLVAVMALALAAAVLFALPGLLGFGNPSAVATPTPSSLGSAPTVSTAPTAVPPATPQVYTVQAGDTMSRIADRFGIPLDVLIAANANTVPDPDQLQIGDQVTIPVPVPSELPAASVIPAAT
jgi:LysM domain